MDDIPGTDKLHLHLLAKSPAQIVAAANAFKMTSNALIYCHTKVPTDHDCSNLSVLAERTQIGTVRGHLELPLVQLGTTSITRISHRFFSFFE